MKLRAGTLGSEDDWQEYHHQYLFNQGHMPRYEDTNRSVFGTLTHSLNPTTFYSLGVNWFYTERFRGDGLYFKDLASYARPEGNPLPRSNRSTAPAIPFSANPGSGRRRRAGQRNSTMRCATRQNRKK